MTVPSGCTNSTIPLELHFCSESENDSTLRASSNIRVVLIWGERSPGTIRFTAESTKRFFKRLT
jgi:hypothetical protein